MIDETGFRRYRNCLKALVLYFVLSVSAVCSALAVEKIPMVTLEGKELRDISDVHIGADGRIMIMLSSGSGVATTDDKLPAGFLKSWGITPEALERAKAVQQRNLEEARAAQQKKSAEDFERAVRAGSFREVGGIVYDLRRPQPGWVRFRSARVLQVLNGGVILGISSNRSQVPGVFVRGLPKTLGDTDTTDVFAKLTGSFTYINKLGDDRTIRAYDVGRPCKRDEIPEAITKQNKPWGKLVGGSEVRDTLAQLPEGRALSASGTGFFITEDGYLVTNYHVVEDAKKLKVRCKAGVFQARIVKSDRAKDLALLKVEGRFKPLPLRDETPVPLGESIFTIGFPNVELQGLEPKYTDGKISSLAGMHDNPDHYQISVPVQPGNSGGPLMDRNGYVAGVVVARLSDLTTLWVSGSLPQNVNYAIKAKVVREFLKRIPEVSLPVAKSALKPEEAVKAAEESVALILVY